MSVSSKIIAGANELMMILEEHGPGPKTGLSCEVALALGKSVSPREFADMVHHCRRVLGPKSGRAVIWNVATQQYGFAEDLAAAEKYIVLWNHKYMASRAETLSATCGAAMTQHGVSVELAVAKATHDNYAAQLRAMVESYEGGVKIERAALRTGLDAQVELEERVR